MIMSDETMLVTIAKTPQLITLMLRYQKGRREAIMDNLRPLRFDAGDDEGNIIGRLEDSLDGLAELSPIHTVGCFHVECTAARE